MTNLFPVNIEISTQIVLEFRISAHMLIGRDMPCLLKYRGLMLVQVGLVMYLVPKMIDGALSDHFLVMISVLALRD